MNVTRQAGAIAALVGGLWAAGACRSSLPEADVTRVAVSDERGAATAANRFGFELYGRVEGGGNRVVSPLSAATALAMAAAGARGETLKQMAAALRVDAMASSHRAFGALLEALSTSDRDPSEPQLADGGPEAGEPPQLHVADRIWAQRGFRYKDEFLALLRDDYGATLGLVDFAKHADEAVRDINAWATTHTGGRIPHLLDPDDVNPFTRLVLTNAVYFRAPWAMPFRKDETHPEDFDAPNGRRQAPMMKQTATFRYASLDGMSVVELPYADRRVSMLVFLPDSRRGLSDVERRIGGRYDGWVGALGRVRVDLWLPRWRTEGAYSLGSALAAMGMKLAFGDRADFSGMTDDAPLYIERVIQKTFIGADEDGTEAAAATAVGMTMVTSLRIEPPPPVVFHADHPFLYVLRDATTGAVLFVGRVVDPS